jgi:cysteine desulfurase/selenocysteine lyase
MSTSDLPGGAGDLDNVIDLTGAQAAAAAGMPDPAELAKLAATFYGTLPATDVPELPQVPGMPAVTAPPMTMPASIPPAFSFVGDLRSIEDLARGFVPAAYLGSWGSTPSEGQLRSAAAAAPAMLGIQSMPWMGGTSAIPGLPTLPYAAMPTEAMVEAASPQIPTAVTPLPGSWTDPMSFGFIELVRPLESMGMAAAPVAAPIAGPIPSELGGLSASDLSSIPFDVGAIRRDFPIFQESFGGRPLVWLDNAATTQKPQAVIDRLSHFYAHENSNVHRAAHQLAARATDAYEAARETVRRFLNASSTREVVFVRGTTEGINLIAQSWGRRNIRKDDEIVITWLEHHANIVPWQMLCAEKGAKLRVAPVDDSGQILLDEYERLLNPRTRLVSFSHVSNALGTVTPVEQMIEMAHRHGAKVVVDGAQSVAHTRVDVQQYDCDFFVFSGHKIFAPTGVGVVYGKADILEHTPPWQGGGNMIKDVTFEKTIYNEPPVRFEAGTGTIADAVGLGAALDYVSRIGLHNIAAYEHDLLAYGTEVLRRIPGLRLIGTAPEKASVLSFVIDGYRTEDIGAALAKEGIAVRAGHHCAQPILRRFGLESTVRPSLAFYNTCEELDALGAALWNLTSGWLR